MRLGGLVRVFWALGWVERRGPICLKVDFRFTVQEEGPCTGLQLQRAPWRRVPGSLLSKIRLQRREKTLTSHICLWLNLPDGASGETRAHLLGETEAQLLVELTQVPAAAG